MSSQTHAIRLELDKETKNTYRYAETTEEGRPPVVGTLYLKKWALPEPAPEAINVEIEPAE